MPIKSGSKGIIGSYFGSTPIIKMYRGSNLVFQLEQEETNPLKALIERTIKTCDTELSDELDYISTNAFRGCNRLESISIPPSVQSIGEWAFYNCSSLKKVESINGIPRAYEYSFYGCTNLKEVKIAEGTTTIYDYSFQESGLTNIILPSTITNINSNVFSNCSSLTQMTILAETPPRLFATSSISTATTTIYVPKNTKTKYESATNWSSLLTRTTNPVTFVELP
jgi:hypothetical protein